MAVIFLIEHTSILIALRHKLSLIKAVVDLVRARTWTREKEATSFYSFVQKKIVVSDTIEARGHEDYA